MTIRGWLLVLPAVFAIGCAANPSGPSDPAPAAEPDPAGTEDLREASPEDESSPAASAKGTDAVVDQARADQLVGEQTTGYLALVDDQDLIVGKNAPTDLDARVENINAQRRALYTDLAAKDGVTVETVAQTTACVLLREKVKVGEAYRTETSKWKVRTFDVPVSTPSFCAAP
jgi:uncharacterized protein YdbL (DUF1318 family)